MRYNSILGKCEENNEMKRQHRAPCKIDIYLEIHAL